MLALKELPHMANSKGNQIAQASFLIISPHPYPFTFFAFFRKHSLHYLFLQKT